MSTRITRISGTFAALSLALVVAASPVVGASATEVRTSAAGRGEQALDLHRTRCAEAWRTAKAEPTVENWKAVGLCEIDRRLATIERLGEFVENARALTDAHEAALERILASSAEGLRALRAEIEADTTLAELHADIRSIFSEFRIYVLVARQVWLVTAADTVTVTGHKLEETAADLAVLIERAAAAGQDVTDARAHLDAMNAAIVEALAGVAGLADDVLPLTPADWNAGTAGPVLREARAAIAEARTDLRTALAEARQVIASLAE
ncbi:MAG: hypothetical protein L0221_03570 [Chloroflexi bacterium]|nr:hypothetical protein [Chloroflexota bacterium]